MPVPALVCHPSVAYSSFLNIFLNMPPMRDFRWPSSECRLPRLRLPRSGGLIPSPCGEAPCGTGLFIIVSRVARRSVRAGFEFMDTETGTVPREVAVSDRLSRCSLSIPAFELAVLQTNAKLARRHQISHKRSPGNLRGAAAGWWAGVLAATSSIFVRGLRVHCHRSHAFQQVFRNAIGLR